MSLVLPFGKSGGKMDTRMTSLIIRALETSPNGTHTVAELYQRLVELNPSLTERETDWQSTVRHTLSTSTMFVLVNDTRPGQWMYNPFGDRSTHKNRRKKETPALVSKPKTRAATTKKKRLGTTIRRGERRKGWPGQDAAAAAAATTTTTTTPSSQRQEARWCWPMSALAPCGLYNNMNTQLYPDVTPLQIRRSSDLFMDDARLKDEMPQVKKQRPSQFVDTTKEPFPPLPQIDALHQIHSQTSSSISFSQYSSQYSQSHSQSQ